MSDHPDAPRPPPRHTPLKPVPGVTWKSHLGCGALLGFFGGFFGALAETDTTGFLVPVLVGLGTAAVIGLVAAVLGDRYWLR